MMIQDNDTVEEMTRLNEVFNAGLMLSENDALVIYNTCAATFKPRIEDLLAVYGFYCKRVKTQKRICLELVHCLGWLVQHYPESIAWRDQEIFLTTTRHKFLQKSLVEFWRKAMLAHYNNPRVPGNAGCTIIAFDYTLAAEYLERAIALDDSNCYWHWLICSMAQSRLYSSFDPGLEEIAKSLLSHGKRFLAMYDSDYSPLRESALNICALSSLILDHNEESKNFANEHIETVSDRSNRPRAGQAILGLLAVKEGEWPEAKRRLSGVSRHDIVCQEDHDLIEQLLDKGHVETAIEFLNKCRDFGLLKTERVDKAKEEIKLGNKTITLW